MQHWTSHSSCAVDSVCTSRRALLHLNRSDFPRVLIWGKMKKDEGSVFTVREGGGTSGPPFSAGCRGTQRCKQLGQSRSDIRSDCFGCLDLNMHSKWRKCCQLSLYKCEWRLPWGWLDFSTTLWKVGCLAIRPQRVQIDSHTSSTLVFNTGAPQGWVLTPCCSHQTPWLHSQTPGEPCCEAWGRHRHLQPQYKQQWLFVSGGSTIVQSGALRTICCSTSAKPKADEEETKKYTPSTSVEPKDTKRQHQPHHSLFTCCHLTTGTEVSAAAPPH